MARKMKVCTITTSSDIVSNASNPLTLIGVEKTPTYAKKPKTAKTFSTKSAKKFQSMKDDSSISFNDFDVDGCNISETILFLQKLALSPNASSMNVAFRKHITNALMKIREEKLKQKVSIPKKLEDGWEPIINMNVNGFDCHALCDLGASISIMPRKIYDMLGLPPFENCYFDVPLADVAKKKPLGRIYDVLIMINNNLVPVDFLVMDVKCNASCPIILGRHFLRTVGAIIDMKEGTIKYQFPLKKGMEHFPRRRKKLHFDSIYPGKKKYMTIRNSSCKKIS
jgi:predicted aspartyl protease